MREANWDEIFQRHTAEAAAAKESRLSSVVPWEDWLTFAIAAVAFMSVVHSVDSANWVNDMPSLYPIGFSGLIVGYLLSRVRLPELLLHPLGLSAGATLVFVQLLAILPGGSAIVRTDALLDRMYIWWSAATQGGISNDTLPFIVLILTMMWLGAYVSSWAIFRWRNPWLGLIPGGTALMWNISFIPGQSSPAFVVFVFAAVLLLMRVHVANKEADWEKRDVVYPEFLSLSVLNATFWVAVGLLLIAAIMPLAEKSDTAGERWKNLTAPVTERFAPLGRVFISVNAKKPIAVHNLKDALAFQGAIKLNSNEAVTLDVEITPEMAAFLREQSFDEYTSSGWKLNVEGNIDLGAGEFAPSDVPAVDGARQDVTVNVTVKDGSDERLFSVGQPRQSMLPAEAQTGAVPEDVLSLKAADDLKTGDTYRVTGSVAVPSIEQLREAGDDYPEWVEDRYLGLPGSLPDRVRDRAEEIAGDAETPYDQAAAIERYLRTFPNDYRVSATPAGRDTVDYFLFDLQRGYFDYHASAMAVMLRSLGVPARVATGYAVDPAYRQADTNTYDLTERSAFAWPEVYFPGIGWVEFSPTPSRPRITRPGVADPAPTPDSSIERPGRPEDEFVLPIDPGAAPDTTGIGEDGGGGWPFLLTVALIGGAVVLLAGSARVAWEFGLSGMPAPARLWEKTLRLARLGGTAARTSETPREFAARLRRDVPGTDGIGYMAAAYERSRFGQKELTDEQSERLESAYAAVRNSLLRRALRRGRDRTD
jgi:transglutaminase-like putative cysteine protease